ncbi:MAG: ATP-dependent DNA helicase RecG [Phycisphaerae bacterium]|nr:ATP-dependent DNA helicase RecG [Phycisphaerae bacterium]
MTDPATAQTWTLTTPVEELPGVTEIRAAALRRMEIRCLAHLIAHLPSRHQYEEAESAIADITVGRLVTVRGEVTDTRAVRAGRARFEAVLLDETGRIDLCWFNMLFLQDRIHPGSKIRIQGKVNRRGPRLQIINPKWEWIPEGAEGPINRQAHIRPIYPATEDMPSWAFERLITSVIDRALPLIVDHLPDDFRKERALPTLAEAYRLMHQPQTMEDLNNARRRLVYDELLLLQLGVHMKRAHVRRTLHAPALNWNNAIDEHIRARIPFTLTPGQEEVIREIAADLRKPTPANRLIQGDVGAGKTVVALYAMLMAAASRHQAALMAPTELLAEQHYDSVSRLLRGSTLRLALLTGSVTGIDRERMMRGIAQGEIDLVIGTHALLTESVSFHSLAVAVIDEQHRFGVHQRATLRERNADDRSIPHTLVMTATPIPRTLALTIFGDLDISTLRGLPPGRTPIATRIMPAERADEVYAFVRNRLDQGEQAFIVAPTIGDDESLLLPEASPEQGTRDVNSILKTLREGPLKGKRLEAIHGRLNRESRERIMDRFRSGQIDALVATTIIEVGVDVPNATLMVIENADRFGLAQLHQLRGRVGRGKTASVCVCITSAAPTPGAEARLAALAATTDGFAIAEKDLELRGPGDFIGARQAGAAPFRLAEFPKDMDLLLLARRDANLWIERSPLLATDADRLIRSRLMKVHGQSLGLVDVA